MPGRASAAFSLENPPPGANDFDCKPSKAHPEPVVLLHGLFVTMSANWSYISPLLAERGYCVFALTYGIDPETEAFSDGALLPVGGGFLPAEEAADDFEEFVDLVRGETGAERGSRWPTGSLARFRGS